MNEQRSKKKRWIYRKKKLKWKAKIQEGLSLFPAKEISSSIKNQIAFVNTKKIFN